MLPEFRNEPFTDFSVDANAKAFRAALAAVEKRLPIRGKNRIGGKDFGASKHFESRQPLRLPAGDRALPRGHRGRRGEGRGRGDESLPGLEPDAARRAVGTRPAHRLDPPAPQARVLRHDGARGVQVLGRGRRRHGRGDRLLRVLRARDGAAGAPPAADALPRGVQRARAHPAGRGRRHPALELSARDPDRHDDRGPRRRKHGRPEALLRRRRHRVDVPRRLRRGRRPGRRVELPHGRRRDRRQRPRRASEDAAHRFHGLARRRPAGVREGGPRRPGPDLDQAGDSRDGRQGLHPRRRDRGRRGSRQGHRRGGLRLPGTEVLGMLAA